MQKSLAGTPDSINVYEQVLGSEACIWGPEWYLGCFQFPSGFFALTVCCSKASGLFREQELVFALRCSGENLIGKL